MMNPNERRRGAFLALLACGVALGASLLLSKRPQEGPGARTSARGEAIVCLVDDDALPPLI